MSRGWPSARAPKVFRRCNNPHQGLLLHPLLLRKLVRLILLRYLYLPVLLASYLIVVPYGMPISRAVNVLSLIQSWESIEKRNSAEAGLTY
jgi:hypothetical protein